MDQYRNISVLCFRVKKAGAGATNAMVVSGTDVYVTGRVGYAAMLWKNSVGTKLSTSNSYAEAGGIAFLNNDLYISGFEDGKSLYWKNGVRNNIASGPKGSGATVTSNAIVVLER